MMWVHPDFNVIETRPLLSKVSKDYTAEHITIEASQTHYIFSIKTSGTINSTI